MHMLTTLVTLFTLFAVPAFAVGSQDNEVPPTPTETTTTCEEGQIFDEKTEECVDADAQSLNDDIRYRALRELAYVGHYERALTVIAAADNPGDPRFLNYQGFIHRQRGKMEKAMQAYRQALALDPGYLLARSYMGMGLASNGDLSGAKEQLREIARRGGRETWAYRALKAAISEGTSVRY